MNSVIKVTVLIFIFSLMYAAAAPKQNRTQVLSAPRRNGTHARSNSNHNRTVAQQIQNSKKADLLSTDELINSILDFALMAFGTLTEIQETIQELPIIGKK